MAVWSKSPMFRLLGLALLVFGFGSSAGAAQNAAGKTANPPEEKSRPLVTGTIRQSQLTVGDTVQTWLTISNPGTDALGPIRLLDVQMPGLALVSWGLAGDEQLKCSAPNRPPVGASTQSILRDCGEVVEKLDRGQSIAVWVNLKAVLEAEESSGVMVVGWSPTGTGAIESQVAVTLGPIRLRTSWQQFWQDFRDIAKDFALPAVAAIFGLWFRGWESRRAQVAETWNKMLSESHKLATEHYMPILAACSEALKWIKELDGLKKLPEIPPEKLEEKQRKLIRFAFFYILLLERRFLHLGQSAGGFYFKNRIGESLAEISHQEFRGLYYWRDLDLRHNFSRMLGYLSTQETVDTFFRKLDGDFSLAADAEFKEGLRNFGNWLQSENRPEATKYLEAFSSILSCEMNRPYEHWYGEKETIRISSELRNLIVNHFKESPNLKARTPEVRAYFDGKKLNWWNRLDYEGERAGSHSEATSD